MREMCVERFVSISCKFNGDHRAGRLSTFYSNLVVTVGDGGLSPFLPFLLVLGPLVDCDISSSPLQLFPDNFSRAG